jgi:glycosyltransferase involved in cell wall biosynthesis
MVELKKLGHEIKVLAYCRGKGEMHASVTRHGLLKGVFYVGDYKRGREKALGFIARVFFDLSRRPADTLKLLLRALQIRGNMWHLFDNYLGLREIRSAEFDLIYVPFPHINHLRQASYLSKVFKRPFVITFRALDLYEKDNKKQLGNKIKLIGKAARIIAISAYNKAGVIKKFGFGVKEGIEIIHSSINVDEFKPVNIPKRRKIISVCRFVEKKGIKYLIEACNILRNGEAGFECLLIGRGPLKSEYERLIEKYGLREHINIKEPMPQEDIKRELADSMIFVLPCIIAKNGDRDILPNVLKEAMAMEVPVVTSDICGIEELIDNGESGILLPPQNPQAIAGAMEELFSNEQLRERLGKTGREKIKKDFNIQIEALKLEKAFKAAAS